MNKNLEKATFAGGCFWCTEAIFNRLKGVKSVIPGYTGGNIIAPTYEQVCSGTTDHAEAIQIEFDSQEISFEKLLDIFWHTHNPTTLNKQGNDVGTQYRSAIFYHNEIQKEISEKLKKDLINDNFYENPVITEIIPFTQFYIAEDYHKKYFDRNQKAPYCQIIINPKIEKLEEEYSDSVFVKPNHNSY